MARGVVSDFDQDAAFKYGLADAFGTGGVFTGTTLCTVVS